MYKALAICLIAFAIIMSIAAHKTVEVAKGIVTQHNQQLEQALKDAGV